MEDGKKENVRDRSRKHLRLLGLLCKGLQMNEKGNLGTYFHEAGLIIESVFYEYSS